MSLFFLLSLFLILISMVHVREYVAYVRLFPSGFRLLRMYVSKFIYFFENEQQ